MATSPSERQRHGGLPARMSDPSLRRRMHGPIRPMDHRDGVLARLLAWAETRLR